MNVAIKLEKCKCGEQEKIKTTCCGSWLYCPKKKWWNFWKHRKTVQFGYYPCKHLK